MSSPDLRAVPPFAATSHARLQSLYSDFARQKHSNPAAYHANVDWWHRALQAVVAAGLQPDAPDARLVLLARRALVSHLRIRMDGVGTPLALGAAIAELQHTNALVPVPRFRAATASVYAPPPLAARAAALAAVPLWWALGQLGVVDDDPPAARAWEGEYVVLALVERAADAVRERQRARAAGAADALYTLDGFRQAFAGVAGGDALSERDARVLVRFLERDRRAVVVDGEVIKFVEADARAEARIITPVDRGILELKTAVANTSAQVDGLQRRADEAQQKATEALRAQHKEAALGYLRTRRQLDDLLTKRRAALATLEGTLLQVEAAAGDVGIVEAYAASTGTLRALLAHPSLQRAHVEETMDAMAEAAADAREIDDTIRAGAGAEEIDEDAVEAELRALVGEVEGERARARLDAAQVPVGAPPEREAGAEEAARPRDAVAV